MLAANVDGYSDFLDAAGRLLGSGPAPPTGSVFLRRWSITPMPDTFDRTWIVQVVVADLRGRALARFVAAKPAKAF